MLIFLMILSTTFTPSQDSLFKKLFLVKYTQEFNLYKNDINFDEKAFRNTIKQQVENRLLLYREAQKKITINQEDLTQRLSELKQDYPQKQLDAIAIKNHMPQELLLKNLTIDIYLQAYFKQLFKNIKITENEIKTYYFLHLEDFTIKKEIQLYHIFSTSQPKIVKIEKKLQNQKRAFHTLFQNLAQELSESPEGSQKGYLGWVSKNDLPAYFSPAFQLRKGRYSKIIQSSAGYHLFYVKDIKRDQYISLEDSKKRIKAYLRSQKQEALLQETIQKLRQKHLKD